MARRMRPLIVSCLLLRHTTWRARCPGVIEAPGRGVARPRGGRRWPGSPGPLPLGGDEVVDPREVALGGTDAVLDERLRVEVVARGREQGPRAPGVALRELGPAALEQ